MAPTDIPTTYDSVGQVRIADPKPTLRLLEIEEPSNRLVIHRFSRWLVPLFIHLKVPPNAVSFMGALSGFCAAWSYHHFENPWACLLGFAFMVGWHVFDGADGQLARRTGQTSRVGFVIDGVCDYLTFVFVYIALGLALTGLYGSWIWGIVLAAAVSHVVQAAAFEMQREAYIAWVHDGTGTAGIEGLKEAPVTGLAARVAGFYRAVQNPFRPLPRNIETALVNNHHGGGAASTARAYKTAFLSTVRHWSVLSANNRTLAIFIFCLAGFPVAYFVYEAVVLNVILVALIARTRAARRLFLRTLS